MTKEIEEYLKQHGCFCGGYGEYTEYNCGESYDVTCPHCWGSGKKACRCEESSLKCKG